MGSKPNSSGAAPAEEVDRPVLGVEPFDPTHAERWDRFVRDSWNGTFMHTRRFLDYHGDRFADSSLVVRDAAGVWLGVLPAARHPAREHEVWSHPGLSYGGIVQAGGLRGARMGQALEAVAGHLRERGFSRLRYKATPAFYHRVPAADDAWALVQLGACRERCDLTSIVDLERRPDPSPRRRRALRRAHAAGVVARAAPERLAELWDVLAENLRRRHDRDPVHDLGEISRLRDWFPDEIELHCGLLEDRVEAGMLLFCTPVTVHAQYIASSPTGYRVSALDAVVEHCVARARERGARYFDFGISTEDEGRSLNAGLYTYKNEFGAGAALHEFYTLAL